MNNIISSYSISKENDEDQEHPVTVPIIKIPIFKNEEKKIEVFEVQPKEEEVIEEEKPVIEPKLQLTRNNEGVVIGIEVQCSCGETILIKMDYK